MKVVSVTRDLDEPRPLTFALDTPERAREQLALEWGDIDWHSNLFVFRWWSTRAKVGPTKSGMYMTRSSTG